MARTLSRLATLGLLASTVALVASASAQPTEAEAATAAPSCDRVALTPTSRTVRRRGRVMVTGHTCGATAAGAVQEPVRLRIRKGKRWSTLATARAKPDGSFSVCTKVKVPRAAKVARLRATAGGATGTITLRVVRKGPSKCEPTDSGSGDSGGGGGGEGGGYQPPPYQPPPPDQPNPDCPISQPGSPIGLTLPSSCSLRASDTASNPNPLPVWGRLDCQSSTRHQQVAAGGDPHLMGGGSTQGDGTFRRLRAIDGDDVWGERCEMGYNWHEASDPGTGFNGPGPTVLFHEGQRRVTFASIRMPSSSPVGNPNWRAVLQMKQTQPYYNPNGGSMFELQQRGGLWYVISDWTDVWTTPATQGVWTRFAFDITYSRNPAVGSIKVYVDLNGDGDASDANEQSPRVYRQTLKPEIAGGSSPIPPGQSIPSHLRAGIYQNENHPCPNPTGCEVDVDNVQVYGP